ncbi:MAG: response regulator [Agarilytica sp.]
MKIRILIVDETAFVRDALKRAVRRFLKEVDIHDAINGQRALPVLRTNKIDIVITDWDMQEMNGRELVEWMRKEEKYAKTPIIITSDEGDKNLVMGAITAGANDFMAKPFSPDEVQKKVVKQLARIGMKPKGVQATNQAENSLSALTGSSVAAKKPKVMKPREIKDAGFGKPAAAKKAPAAKASNFTGTAHVHFSNGTLKCDIKDLSLTGLSGVLERPPVESMPQIFEQASADIEDAAGKPIAQLNVYVHALQAADPRPDSGGLKINLRYADNEPEKFEQLSKAVARSR